MKTFSVGDVVRVIDGPRKGEVTTVTSELEPIGVASMSFWSRHGFTPTTPIHKLDLASEYGKPLAVYAPPAWLEHLHDSREKGEWDELTRKLCERGRVEA